MEDRSALFNQLKGFSQRKLKKVETKVVTGLGEQLVEKRGAKGLQVLSGSGAAAGDGGDSGQEPARKLDLQVGMVLPGLLMGSDDVARDKSSLESYGVTHILNLACAEVENKFEEEYNYKSLAIEDRPDFELDRVLEDCFDFIDDGRHYGNVLVHCRGTIGLSRSTALCIGYLMAKERQSFQEAWNNVKEARSFVKPNEGFQRQLKDYEVKLRGAAKAKESGIDDPFALRKKQEIEQEKAMVAGAASVKNRMKMFGATLEAGAEAPAGPRSKSASPSPFSNNDSKYNSNSNSSSSSSSSNSNNNNNANSNSSTTTTNSRPASKWSTSHQRDRATGSKSMTPEPRSGQPSGPPPPPPPMPTGSLHDKSIKPTISSQLPPPPPPPAPPGDLLRDKPSSVKSRYPASSAATERTTNTATSSPPSQRKSSVSSDEGTGKRVFGVRPPPPMKLRGGISMERQDSEASENVSPSKPGGVHPKSSLKLPLKKQFTSDSESGDAAAQNPRAPSPSAALRAAKQQATAAAGGKSDDHKPSGGQLNRSSTKKLLNLIKTKTRTDLTLADGDENDEIDALLGALESESIDNIDWDELGLDEDEVKSIIKRGGEGSQSASSSSSDDDEEEEEEEEVETSTVHYVIRSK